MSTLFVTDLDGTLLGADANNYAVSVNSTATASITPKALTGSITAAGKTYDGNTAARSLCCDSK